jgi:transcriptional regulator with XRE-family HTH domain
METTFASRMKEVLKRSKLTQTEFAKRISISQQYLSMMCSGKNMPSDRTISDICREFGVDEIWLRTGEGEPFRQESRDEEIMRFASQTIQGSDEFKKALVSMLAKLDPEDWENLAKIYAKATAQYKKSE